MSIKDLDRPPRIADYMRPEQMNDDGVLTLAKQILTGAAEDYIYVRQNVVAHPNNENAREHYKTMCAFYRSKWFAALSLGIVDGEDVMRRLNREAIRGARVRAYITGGINYGTDV